MRFWRPGVLAAAIAVLVVAMPAASAAPAQTPTTAALTAGAAAAGVPVSPYVEPDQLEDPPSGAISFTTLPWRAYLDTVPATEFLDGIGMGWHFPVGTDNGKAMQLLADAGVRRVRIEIPWSAMAWPGTALDPARADRYGNLLDAARDAGIRPLILLNANHINPGPHQEATKTVVSGGQVGSQRLVLDSVDGLTVGHSGLSDLTQKWMDEVLFTAVDPETKTVTLSKRLPTLIADGTSVTVDTLRYAPLHAPGDPELAATIAGWTTYAHAVVQLVRDHRIGQFDVEIWNELTFGSNFLDIANYDTSKTPQGIERFRPGGSAWRLADATTKLIHADFAGVSVVWGFSNTSFLATDVPDLPAGTNAESYHPYHTAPTSVPDGFPAIEDRQEFSFIPDHLVLAMPEGQQQLALSEHSLIRDRLSPAVRDERPPGTDNFEHVFTEHGVSPGSAGITDPAASYDYKARAALRIFTFWLDKGIDRIYLSTAYKGDPLGSGMARTDINPADYGDHSVGDLMTPPLQALQHLTSAFDGAEHLSATRALGFDVTSLGEQRVIVPGDATHTPLFARDLLAILPYQVTATRFTIGAYVMSYDLRQRLLDMPFRLTIHDLHTDRIKVRLYDPLTDKESAVTDLVVGTTSVTFTIPVDDSPRLILVDEEPPRPVPTWMHWGSIGLAVLLVLVALRWHHRRRRGRALAR